MIRKLEKLAAAVAFAEANEHQTALEILDELKTTFPPASRKIVLATNCGPIKPGLVEYGLGLASRMRYQTLFLNLLPSFPGHSEFQRLAENDRETVRKTAGEYENLESATQLMTRYAALLGDWRSLIEQATHRLGGVEMVILQKRKNSPCVSGLPVPVFCLDQ